MSIAAREAGNRSGASTEPSILPSPKTVSTPLERLRGICLALPETNERVSHGEPTWFVRDKKVFVTYADQHHDDRVGFWCAAAPGEQESQLASAPLRFFRPPYVGGRGWLGVWLDVEVDWSEIDEIVRDAYRQIASKRLVLELDSR